MSAQKMFKAFEKICRTLDHLANKCINQNLTKLFTEIEYMESELHEIMTEIPDILNDKKERELKEILKTNQDYLKILLCEYFSSIEKETS